MSNNIGVNMKQLVLQLSQNGWSIRRIANELKLNRRTVKKYADQNVACTISTAGADAGTESKCTIPTAGADSDSGATCTIPTAGRKSLCEGHESFIRAALMEGLSAQRIYQDLKDLRAFSGSYESVKRYVHKLEKAEVIPFRRMEVLPGSQCQVDYGTGAWVLDGNGKRKKTHLFRIVLSCSRKAYSEVSRTQETEFFLRAMENAFRYFGGVPQTVVIDNLKAGVLKPCVYDPELNPKLRDFAAHYGTCILPARVRTPEHKGKVERQVGYAQDNGLKARTFKSIAEQNAFLLHWEANVADQRIHGTLRHQVQCMFAEEKPFLGALPPDFFPLFREGRRIVQADGHVEVARAYYSVPPEFTRRTVWVRFDGRMVEIFNGDMQRLCVHPYKEPGQRSTHSKHIHPQKISNPERGCEWMLSKAHLIGNEALSWAKSMLIARGICGTRVLNGLLSLRKKHTDSAINAGCAKALDHQEFSYKNLCKHIQNATEHQLHFDFIGEHPLIRSIAEYDTIINSKEIFE